jgi:hypothetical protein
MTDTFIVGGTCQATNFIGSAAGLTGITRASLSAGTADYVVINDGTGAMSEEQYLATTRGGFGLSTAAFSGVGKVAAGVWSASTIVDVDINAAAAITRTKLASGSADHVIINNGSGVISSEAQLATSRGGTGQDFSAIGAGPFVVTASSGALAATVGYGSTSAASTIVQRDASQNFAANQITAATIASSANLTISPTGGFVDFGTAIRRAVPTTIAGGVVISTAANVSTANATPTTIYTLATASNVAYSVRVLIALFNVTSTNTIGLIGFHYRVKNIAGTVTNSAVLSQTKSVDSGLTAVDVSLSTATTNSLLQVVGIAATDIKWCAEISVVSQTI